MVTGVNILYNPGDIVLPRTASLHPHVIAHAQNCGQRGDVITSECSMKCVSCILLLCLSTLTAGQTVNLLKSIGLSQKTISGITVASESDSYRQSGVSSPAYSFDGVDKTLAVSSSDATTILAGVGQTEYSVATLIRRTKRLTSGQSGSIVLFSIKSPSGLETRLEIRMVYELRKNDRSCPASCHDLRIEVERSGSVTTFVDNDLFNDLTDVSVWRYLVVVFRVQAAGADIGRSNAEVRSDVKCCEVCR